MSDGPRPGGPPRPNPPSPGPGGPRYPDLPPEVLSRLAALLRPGLLKAAKTAPQLTP